MALGGLELGLIGIGISTAGAGLSAFQSIQQGNFNKKVAERNAAHEAAARRRNRRIEEEQLRDRLSAIKARSGASGLVFGGSTLDVYEETIERFRRDQEIEDINSSTQQAATINQGNLLQQDAFNSAVGTSVGALGSAALNSALLFEGT